MTTVNVGSVVRARATFRDGGKLFDPRFVVVDVVTPSGTRRMMTSTGDVVRESIGVYSALVPVGAGPSMTVRFSDGRYLMTEQKFDVVAKPDVSLGGRFPMEASPLRSDAAEQARAHARAALEQDQRDAAGREAAKVAAARVAELRAKARAEAQAKLAEPAPIDQVEVDRAARRAAARAEHRPKLP